MKMIIKFVKGLLKWFLTLFNKKMDFKSIKIGVSIYRTMYVIDKTEKGLVYYDMDRDNRSKRVILKEIDFFPCLNVQYLIKNITNNQYEIPNYSEMNFDKLYNNDDCIFETNIDDLFNYILNQMCLIIESSIQPINLNNNKSAILSFDLYRNSINEIKKQLKLQSYTTEYDTIKDLINYLIYKISYNTNMVNGYTIGDILQLRGIDLLKLS
jgi:hypothetical protein